MSPIDFVIFDGDSKPNTPIYKIAEAMTNPIIIRTHNKNFTILSYFYNNNQMILEIEED